MLLFSGSPGSGYILFFGVRAMEPFPHWGAREKPEPEWDPMRFMIEECHRRAMEFHAWINPYRVKNKLDDELASTHIYNRHPEWFVVYGDQLFLIQRCLKVASIYVGLWVIL